MFVPTKSQKRQTQLGMLPATQAILLQTLLEKYDALRRQAKDCGLERSFIDGIQTDVTGYGSLSDTYQRNEKVPAPAAK